MKMKNTLANRILSIVLCMAMLLSCLPTVAFAARTVGQNYFDRVVDANTMDGWEKYFDLNDMDTSNAGGVWTDKTVLTDAAALPGNIQMAGGNENFLTVLSALAANKEVVGYSTIPTDTVLVLDVSGSMNQDEQDLAKAANDAIAKLLSTNKNNRVGVVAYSASGQTGSSTYSQSVTRLLPIGRYTTQDGVYLNGRNNTISVNSNVRVEGVSQDTVQDVSKNVSGGTYIQAGLWEAMEMFEEMDTVITDNNWQNGENRMPILVLMSDGAPTTGTTYYDDVENSQYSYTSGYGGPFGQQIVTVNGSNVGNGNQSNMTVGQGFLVQLTASYVKNRVQNHYKTENGVGKSLFYTLGFNLSGSDTIAMSVLDPDRSTATDSLWNSYNALTAGTLSVQVKNHNGNLSNVAIHKNSYATDKSYVDEYFSASGNGLEQAFADIVEEIILQSRYYPTHLEGGNPDFSGYVEFTDTLGEYMEVKRIAGILLGDILFDGHMMASKLADTTSGGLGTPESPTALGDDFIRAVKTRLGIADTAQAQALVAKAYAAGQLKYVSDTDWSNYIGWYAKADGTYNGFWDETSVEKAPEGSVYKIKSYGFLGETTGSIKNSDMMYMSVQVRTDIATGMQTVTWKIPAALVPMVTYLVSLDGANVDQATNVQLSVADAGSISPIRLVYETGLRSDLNPFNITRITDRENLASDGHTRIFWNNYFDISAANHDEHITAQAEFMPNPENERFYFTFDSAVHKKSGSDYVLVGQNETLDENGEYYHRRYIFREGETKPVFFYEKMSAASIRTAKNNGWQAGFETLDGQTGAWVVPAGTPARELQMYDEEKAVNATDSAHMVFHPYLIEQNNTVYVDMNLGNNGRLAVTPAEGIKISKTVDVFEEGTSDTFRFRIRANVSGSCDVWVTPIGQTPEGAPAAVTFTNGVYEFDLSKDQTLWITGIPAGTAYTVEEISDNDNYKIKSVHVNGISTGDLATGTVARYLMDDVEFVNTAMGEGDLVITKQVVDTEGRPVNVSSSLRFTAEVALTEEDGTPVTGTFQTSTGTVTADSTGTFTVTLAAGGSVIVRGIPETTRYTVVETAIPAGFVLDAQRSTLSGAVDAAVNDQALIVNTYDPVSVGGNDVSVRVNKQLSGNRTQWVAGESYTFTLERLGADGAVLATKTISAADAEKTQLFDLSGEVYTEAGIYTYRITEAQGTQGGITYDTAERRFTVAVADSDMDGDLEIVAVANELNTTVTGQWLVTADFNNVYAPTGSATVTVEIQKAINGGHALNGYQFALYDADPMQNIEANEILRSALTDASGKTAISLTYAANRATMAGDTYTYYLAEVNAGQTINNIRYSTQVYKIQVTVKDNGDGTISAELAVDGATVPTFTNEYVPSSSDFVTISGKKTTTDNRVLNTGEFKFLLTAQESDAPMPAEAWTVNVADGSFRFGAIEFGDSHKGRTFHYTVTEDNTDPIGGFAYDRSVYTVTVTVTDNGDQTITATAQISKGGNSAEDIIFHNAYDPEDARITLSGNKILTGKVMEDGEFSFRLEAVTAGAPMPANPVATNNAGGAFSFATMVYDRAGVYVYTLTEVVGSDSRYVYDTAVYTVTVTVRDDSQGELTATVVLKKDNLDAGQIVFRNGFIPTPVTYDIHTDFGGSKELAGRELAEGEFQFALINAINGQQIGEAVRNDANGAFRFPAVTLPEAGIYHYKITEVVGDEKGITYDISSYHVRLEVIQNTDGTLRIADKKLYKGVVEKVEVGGVLTETTRYENITDGGQIVFHNTYKADPVYITIQGTKILTGRTLKDKEFGFSLYGEDGKLIQTVSNNAQGSFVFDSIVADEAGTYVFTVREDKGTEEGMTYDEAVFTVTVTVTDNLDGTFKTETTVKKNTAAAEGVVFLNTYTAPVPPSQPQPDPTIPQTGDSSPLWMWAAAMVVSGGLMTLLLAAKKKEESQA